MVCYEAVKHAIDLDDDLGNEDLKQGLANTRLFFEQLIKSNIRLREQLVELKEKRREISSNSL